MKRFVYGTEVTAAKKAGKGYPGVENEVGDFEEA